MCEKIVCKTEVYKLVETLGAKLCGIILYKSFLESCFENWLEELGGKIV